MVKKRILSAIFFPFVVLLPGCATHQLQSSTVATGRTATEILYSMVLDNLAMFVVEPNALPWHIKITQGAITINDSFTPTLSYVKAAAISRTVQLAGSQSAQVSWTVVPVVDKTTLVALQGIYQEAAKSASNPTLTTIYAPIKSGTKPCGSYQGKQVCVVDMVKFATLVTDVLAITSVLPEERAPQLPGPAVSIERSN